MKLLKALKNSFLQLCLVSAVLLMMPFFALAAEKIDSFDSVLDLSADGTFVVTETILYDFGEAERHGIFRYIEKKHPQEPSSPLKERYLQIELLEVMQDGGDVPYEKQDSKSKLEVKIGDANTTISGSHEYKIVYEVIGGYSYLDNGIAEVYWNVTGNGWEVPIVNAVAHVRNREITTQQRACYAGLEGESGSCEIIESEGEVIFIADDLGSQEGITIAQSLDAQKIEVRVLERYNFILLLVIVLPFLALGIGIFGYRYRTEHKTGNPIIAQYEPYKDFKPMYAGMLFDGSLDPHDITAGIVYLAEQGFLKIRKTEKKVLFLFEVDDYEIELLRPFEEVESNFLRTVLELLFSASAPVGEKLTLSTLKNNTQQQAKNLKLLQQLRKDLKNDLEQSGFFQTNKTAQILLFVFGGFLFLMFFIGEFIFLFLGLETLLLFIVAMFCGLILSVVCSNAEQEQDTKPLITLKVLSYFFLSLTLRDLSFTMLQKRVLSNLWNICPTQLHSA
jgi:hypothetical protein